MKKLSGILPQEVPEFYPKRQMFVLKRNLLMNKTIPVQFCYQRLQIAGLIANFCRIGSKIMFSR